MSARLYLYKPLSSGRSNLMRSLESVFLKHCINQQYNIPAKTQVLVLLSREPGGTPCVFSDNPDSVLCGGGTLSFELEYF